MIVLEDIPEYGYLQYRRRLWPTFCSVKALEPNWG